MAHVPLLLLEHLNDLSQEDFGSFKLFLSPAGAKDYSPIGRKNLEDAKQHKVVELMMDRYGPEEAARITVQILKEIKQYSLVTKLEKELAGGPADPDHRDGASTSLAPAPRVSQAPQISQVINAGQSSTVKAPVVTGGHFSGPVNFN